MQTPDCQFHCRPRRSQSSSGYLPSLLLHQSSFLLSLSNSAKLMKLGLPLYVSDMTSFRFYIQINSSSLTRLSKQKLQQKTVKRALLLVANVWFLNYIVTGWNYKCSHKSIVSKAICFPWCHSQACHNYSHSVITHRTNSKSTWPFIIVSELYLSSTSTLLYKWHHPIQVHILMSIIFIPS